MSKRQRFLIVNAGAVGSIPAPTGSGAAMGTFALMKILRERGHEVGLCHLPILTYKSTPEEEREQQKRVENLEKMGITVDVVEVSSFQQESRAHRGWKAIRSVFSPRVSDYYPFAAVQSQVLAIVKKRNPDVIHHHSTNTVAATQGTTVPRLVMTGDLDDLVLYYRWRMTSVWSFHKYVYNFLRWVAARKLNATLMQMLRSCALVVSVAYHIVDQFKKAGVNCIYLPNPWATNTPPPFCLEGPQRQGKPKALMLGHLTGIATLSGLYFLVEETLPELVKLLGPDGFEVHIVGRDEVPADLRRKLNHPNIKMRGYVEDIHAEYKDADITLVPTPIVVGARTRIAEAFSVGSCVVAHQANAPGMRELVHDQNILLADSGKELAAQIARALKDPALRRRIAAEGRKTWETFYAPDKAIVKMALELEKISATVPADHTPTPQTVRG